jgi:proteasome lid subunit RPN8/RPN11
MIHGLVNSATRFLGTFNWSLVRDRIPHFLPTETTPPPLRSYQRLRHVLLTDEVSRTLFGEFAAHRQGPRSEEEIGWVLLGVRENNCALVLAALPAGAQRNAGVGHVQFNSQAQAVASRIVRQWDKRLTILGVVHTHPGSLRHPSDGDFQGDNQWVSQLRCGEGIFAIGTADGRELPGTLIASQPEPHVQMLGELCFSWYSLRQTDRHYQPLEVRMTLGPDLAAPLCKVWATIEHHAEPLERLCRQQAGMTFAVIPVDQGSALSAQVKLAEPESALKVVLHGETAQYFLERGQEQLTVDAPAAQVDRGVYLVLAELAGQG